ncbi:hypothetical protein ACJMK2_007071 [Sinanodonta woodiana]|uniref:Cathepsin L n=1 Tax=Sinanodonta woodiana TaxID=1069815 RepID=A0ABD3VJT5_SINWO
MKFFAITLFLEAALIIQSLSVQLNHDLDDEWEQFKVTYRRQYKEDEELVRRGIWERAVKIIEAHNLEADKGKHTYWMGVNEYADLTAEEWKKMNGFVKKTGGSKITCGKYSSSIKPSDLPMAIDWRAKGYVTHVENQGQCGSCWAFAANGALEGQHYKKTRKLVALSAQNLMDCSRSYGNDGCCGGLMDYAFQYIVDNHGIDTELSYPYLAKDDTNCHFNKSTIGATEVGCMDIKQGSEDDLQKAVATVGPVAMAMDAVETFVYYKSGVYSDPTCQASAVNHAMLVTGYGVYQGKQYWMLKNSFGTSWGINGYMMIARNKNNMCGVATVASFPTV